MVGEEKPVKSVMFVPFPPKGELRRRLPEKKSLLIGYGSIKYMEKSGRTIQILLVKPVPWAGNCGRDNCFLCNSGNTGVCMDQWALYQIDWLLCKMERKKTNSIGETARTLWDRGVEHLDKLKRKQPESVLHCHQELEHPRKAPKFAIRLVKRETKKSQKGC